VHWSRSPVGEKNFTEVNLRIDWKALGIDPQDASITAPAIANFQDAVQFKSAQSIPVLHGWGWLLWIAGQGSTGVPGGKVKSF
jgi:hypothetical protein